MDRKPKLNKVGLLLDPNRPEHRFDVDRPSMIIGRGQDSDVVIDNPTVSRHRPCQMDAVATGKSELWQFHL